MALFQWIVSIDHKDLLKRIESAIEQMGMEVDREFSKNGSIYARDRDGAKTAASSRVTVIATPNNGSKNEYLLEVRSSEPMLKRGTRCEQVASAIQASISSKI